MGNAIKITPASSFERLERIVVSEGSFILAHLIRLIILLSLLTKSNHRLLETEA